MRKHLAAFALLALFGCDNPSYVRDDELRGTEVFRTADGCLWKVTGSINSAHWVQNFRKIEKLPEPCNKE